MFASKTLKVCTGQCIRWQPIRSLSWSRNLPFHETRYKLYVKKYCSYPLHQAKYIYSVTYHSLFLIFLLILYSRLLLELPNCSLPSATYLSLLLRYIFILYCEGFPTEIFLCSSKVSTPVTFPVPPNPLVLLTLFPSSTHMVCGWSWLTVWTPWPV